MNWLHPIPGETVIGAIIGAVLSTIMSNLMYFNVGSWLDCGFPLLMVGYILSFGLCIHFFCAAVELQHRGIGALSGSLSLIILVIMLFSKPKIDLFVSGDGTISFAPNSGHVLMAGVLFLWFSLLFVLTLVRIPRTDQSVGSQ